MSSFRNVSLTITTLALCSLGTLASVQAQMYRITDLGTLGGETSFATSLNSQGDVVGSARTATGDRHAFLWRNGVMSDISVTFGTTTSTAWDINDFDQIVGQVFVPNSSDLHAFYYNNGTFQDIGGIGAPRGFTIQSSAWGINNAGQVVGRSTFSTGSGHHAFIWDAVHGYTDLSSNVSFSGDAYGINNVGNVVGEYDSDASLYSGNTHQLLGAGGIAWNINNNNEIVGTMSSLISGNDISYGHAFHWQNGQLSDLGTLPGFGGSTAQAINDMGQMVGNVFNLDNTGNVTSNHAFIDNGSGLVDLNTLVPTDSGWTLNVARDINNTGMIVGSGTFNGQQRAYMLTPAAVPELSIVIQMGALAVTGGAGLLVRKRRK